MAAYVCPYCGEPMALTWNGPPVKGECFQCGVVTVKEIAQAKPDQASLFGGDP